MEISKLEEADDKLFWGFSYVVYDSVEATGKWPELIENSPYRLGDLEDMYDFICATETGVINGWGLGYSADNLRKIFNVLSRGRMAIRASQGKEMLYPLEDRLKDKWHNAYKIRREIATFDDENREIESRKQAKEIMEYVQRKLDRVKERNKAFGWPENKTDLTPEDRLNRSRDIARLRSQGVMYKEIAEKYFISPGRAWQINQRFHRELTGRLSRDSFHCGSNDERFHGIWVTFDHDGLMGYSFDAPLTERGHGSNWHV
jgi:hypothetical protein